MNRFPMEGTRSATHGPALSSESFVAPSARAAPQWNSHGWKASMSFFENCLFFRGELGLLQGGSCMYIYIYMSIYIDYIIFIFYIENYTNRKIDQIALEP